MLQKCIRVLSHQSPHASPLAALEITVTVDISAKVWPRGSSVDMLDESCRTAAAVRMASLGDARNPSRFPLSGRGRHIFCKVHQQATLPCIETLCCAVRRAWVCSRAGAVGRGRKRGQRSSRRWRQGRPSARQKTGSSPTAISARRLGPAGRPAEMHSGQNPTYCSEDEDAEPLRDQSGAISSRPQS